jgi:hypothetical protein
MYLTDKGKHLLRMRTEKEFSSKWTLKAGMNSGIFIYDKTGFKPKLVRTDTEGHFIFIKGTMHQEDITIVNISAPNFGALSFIK